MEQAQSEGAESDDVSLRVMNEEKSEVGVISNAQGGVLQSKQLPYVRLVLMWNVALGMIGGTSIYLLEGNLEWLDCFYVAINATTATGLTSIDLTRLRAASLVLVAALMQLGAATLLSCFPVVMRIMALEAILPRTADQSSPKRWWRRRKIATFDLRRYRLVPEWLVEYKALVFLLRIILCYHAVVYIFYGTILACYVAFVPPARHSALHDSDATPGAWACFTVITSFNNVGFTLQNDGFAKLHDKPVALLAVGMLVLHGNVLYPACLRWIVVWLSAVSPHGSNRKVYLRYLLLHGRKLYSHMFSSQATWLLVATQLALISLQVTVTLLVSRNDKSFRGRQGASRIDLAAFQAVNTRHAGITAVNIATLHGGTLVLQMAMMWLAPVPLVAALSKSSEIYTTQSQKRERCVSDATAEEEDDADMDESARSRRRRQRSGRRITVSLLPTDEAPPPRETHIPDAMVDTRALLLERYPDRSPPWTERISTRLDAFAYHCRRTAYEAYGSSGFARDAGLIFLAWFAIACFENFKHVEDCSDAYPGAKGLFHAAFELASAFGNVGLSLGSIKHPEKDASFSTDLCAASLLVLILVQIGARTRDMPRRIDASMTLPSISGDDCLVAPRPEDRPSAETHSGAEEPSPLLV